MSYIDLELAVKYSYSKDLLIKFVNMFIEEYKNFDLSLVDLNQKEILSKVHKLKGITLNLGAQKLYESCLTIEESNDFNEDLKSFIYIFNKSYSELLNL